MTGLQFIPLGVGDAFSALHYSSSLAVGAEGHWILVDCPHPIRKILREAGTSAGIGLDVDRFDAIILTHLHADHSSGLEGWGSFSHFVLGRTTRVLALPSVIDRLWDDRLAPGMEQLLDAPGAPPRRRKLWDYFEPGTLDEHGAVEAGPFSIECRPTVHPIPTAALRISAKGRSLGLSADTAYDPDLIAWLGQADLVVHETGPGIHTPYEKLVALPAELRARMRLIHYPDSLDVEHSAIEPLRQGVLYRV